jgi:PPM family protein phosphatase
MTVVTIATATDTGRRKKENEDFCAYYPPEEGSQHKKGILLALADGMGGRAGGATASKIAVDVLMQEYYRDFFGTIPESLAKAFQKANQAVIAKGMAARGLEGMATTLTAVVLKDDKMYHAHVGDSRAYVIYEDRITHFTEDHSYVASLVKAGAITEEEALTHPQANVITRAIGADEELKIDLCEKPRPLKNNEYILLCCDGLYKDVSDAEILGIVREHKEIEVACQKLVDKANEYGGTDNITVLIARIDRLNLASSILNRFKSPV